MRDLVNALACRLLDHDDEYTAEFENADGYVQADAICSRCGRRRVAWVGPPADQMRAAGADIPEVSADA